jgi:tubulin---tyrosine ligase
LRVFGVAHIINGPNGTREFRGYFFKEGYLRTSSREFNINDLENRYVHLTNDAIQKKSADYGKFETGNKMSYDDFQDFLKTNKNVDFYKDILPQIKQSVTDTLEALSSLLEEQSRTELGANNSCFELFGYDFMMDDDMKLVLIEVNTNPCLETESCPLLSRLISQVVDQTFKVAVDPFFDGTENEIGLSQEYPISEIKMEMVVCRNLRLPEPGEDETE